MMLLFKITCFILKLSCKPISCAKPLSPEVSTRSTPDVRLQIVGLLGKKGFALSVLTWRGDCEDLHVTRRVCCYFYWYTSICMNKLYVLIWQSGSGRETGIQADVSWGPFNLLCYLKPIAYPFKASVCSSIK